MTDKDTRIAYGARCTWWDSIYSVGLRRYRDSPHGLPCCPKCGGPLFKMKSQVPWDNGVKRYEADGHPGYGDMVAWGRGKCFPNLAAEEAAYAEFKAGAAE